MLGNRRVAERVLFIVLPVVVVVCSYAGLTQAHSFAVDFVHEYVVAAGRLQRGLDPYNPASVGYAGVALGPVLPFTATTVGLVFVWPFAVLPVTVGAILFALLTGGCAVLALRVLRVRDWRLYGLVIVLPPVMSGWANANVTLVAVLGLALAWRYRDRPFVAGALGAVAVSLKPFMWPVGLWFLATRRYRAAAWSLGLGAAINLLGFALLGHGSLTGFIRVSELVSQRMISTGYGPAGLAAHLGAGSWAAAIGYVAAAAAGVYALRAGRRGNELGALVAVCGVMLLAGPVVWLHYLSVLLVPLAIARPRLDRVWLCLLVLWVVPVANPTMIENLLVIAVSVAVAISARNRVTPRPQTKTENEPLHSALVAAH